MKRNNIQPRENYGQIIESLGFNYHPEYWKEDSYYEFTMEQVNQIETATNDLEERCLELCQHVIDKNLFHELDIADQDVIALIKDSWDNDEFNVYGRFDFSYNDEDGSLKMLEYNADTPTSLYEQAVIQWQWLEQCFPNNDQFNSTHEKLIEAWKRLKLEGLVHFTCVDDGGEDIINTQYLQDTAFQSGLSTKFLPIADVGYRWEKGLFSEGKGHFLDMEDVKINTMFKLYPWEWLNLDEFRDGVFKRREIRLIEPAWKMILSNKGMYPILYSMFPDHPNLLETYADDGHRFEDDASIVIKPFYSREGQNIEIYHQGGDFLQDATTGEYGEERKIYQRWHPTSIFKDQQDKNVIPIIGSWVIASESSGIGIREDYGITSNMARFVPHIIKG